MAPAPRSYCAALASVNEVPDDAEIARIVRGGSRKAGAGVDTPKSRMLEEPYRASAQRPRSLPPVQSSFPAPAGAPGPGRTQSAPRGDESYVRTWWQATAEAAAHRLHRRGLRDGGTVLLPRHRDAERQVQG